MRRALLIVCTALALGAAITPDALAHGATIDPNGAPSFWTWMASLFGDAGARIDGNG